MRHRMRADDHQIRRKLLQRLRRHRQLFRGIVPAEVLPFRMATKDFCDDEQHAWNVSLLKLRQSIEHDVVEPIVESDSRITGALLIGQAGDVCANRNSTADQFIHLTGELLTLRILHCMVCKDDAGWSRDAVKKAADQAANAIGCGYSEATKQI